MCNMHNNSHKTDNNNKNKSKIIFYLETDIPVSRLSPVIITIFSSAARNSLNHLNCTKGRLLQLVSLALSRVITGDRNLVVPNIFMVSRNSRYYKHINTLCVNGFPCLI